VLNPLDVDHMTNRARLYRILADYESDSVQKIKYLQNASAWYEQALSRSPGRVQLWNEWGLIHFLMGDIDRSLEKFSRSLSLDSLFLPTYMVLGQLYMLQERWEEATWAYEKVIAQNDTSAAAHSGLGITYARLGRFDDAIRANYRVLELKPGDHISHTNLALLYQHQGRTREALNHAQSALRTAPNDERPAIEGFIIQLYQQLGTYAGENEDILDKHK
jgi:tetratricopeptide (TPR) repeat protein